MWIFDRASEGTVHARGKSSTGKNNLTSSSLCAGPFQLWART